ncbi:PiggyBac transposable element-derived protein 4 [Orchesella cincta]|uniref:PiggyBac transposable element-derived protein 4 n=1 Tax=Orchesella cincta TaxID=48709 RepID=A0A1D2M7S1_ORCCI|nr:PiggyBac transposable element-derived protein 4 [Orchesella cincta]
MIIQICQETNRYAAEVKAKNPNALKDWKDVNSNEMWVFLAINVAMGLLRKPSVRDYWSSNEVLSSPFFPETMSRNRFQHILQCLHLVDNEGVPEENRDRFVKLGDFLPDLLINSRACVNPGEYLCLDESLLGFKGRISFRQYNPKKRSRFGIKFFVLVDCMTHLILDIIPYQGKTTNVSSADIKQFGFGGAAVLALLQPYLHKNHKVVIDNFFNGPILARKLLDAKTFVLGTAQKRRKLMPPGMTSKLAKGQVETYSDGEILVER